MRTNNLLTSLHQKISIRPYWFQVSFVALTTLGVYTCMFGFRKAFTAASFAGLSWLGVQYKIWAVSAQVIGYMCSKFYGIRFIAEVKPKGKPWLILKLICLAWLALLGFAILPAPYNIVMMLLNGFPLGMIWGLVFGYVEGRRATEMIGVVLASSFIFASGLAKTVGTFLVQHWHIPEKWMPFAAGAVYFIPLIVITALLHGIPPPSPADHHQRTVRLPMTQLQRKQFMQQFGKGLLLFIPAYILITIIRDFRDNFSPEILADAGLTQKAAVFTQTETIVALLVLAASALLVLVKNNFRAFAYSHYLIIFGFAISAGCTWFYQHQLINGYVWFVTVGTGLYVCYTTINCIYFERMIASYQIAANVGFVIYLADSFGYLGTVAILALRQFAGLQLSWLSFFSQLVYIASIAGIVLVWVALVYFKKQYHSGMPLPSGQLKSPN